MDNTTNAHAALYCKTLDSVSREEMVNAIHSAVMQFNAISRHESPLLADNQPIAAELTRILVKAGHIGFTA